MKNTRTEQATVGADIVNFLREIIMHGKAWPDHCKRGKVFAFAKGGGNSARIENTRTLVATSHLIKICELAIVKGLEEACRKAPDFVGGENLAPILNITENYQAGFTSGLDCTG